MRSFLFVNQHSELEHHQCLICFHRSIIYKWAISHMLVYLRVHLSSVLKMLPDKAKCTNRSITFHHIPTHSIRLSGDVKKNRWIPQLYKNGVVKDPNWRSITKTWCFHMFFSTLVDGSSREAAKRPEPKKLRCTRMIPGRNYESQHMKIASRHLTYGKTIINGGF